MMILKWIMKRRVWTEFSKLRMWMCAGALVNTVMNRGVQENAGYLLTN